jgi:IS30 family transposase
MRNIQQKGKKRNNKWYITFFEREIIEKLVKQKVSHRKIWKIIWRWKSSISDEINRYRTPAMWYEAVLAERQFHRNQRNKWNKKKIDCDNRIKQFILDWLDKDWSPEEISWRIRKFHSNSDIESYVPYVCMETIYSFLYAKENKHLRLYSKLRRHRHKRIKYWTRKKRTVDTIIKNRVSIKERENIIEKRKRVGDFESDSVIFPGKKAVLNTNICRTTRLARIELVKDKTAVSSISVQKNIVYEMDEIWVNVFSFTFDNGWENALHQQLNELWVKTYFCDPYCSYQKGAIENLNMFIRQYLPRNTDVSKLTQQDIYIIQEKLNNRPRKCLWYLSPNEFFYKKTWVKPN